MENIYAIIVGLMAFGDFFFGGGLLVPLSKLKSDSDGELIDPSDSRQIALLIGLSGGRIADAAVAKLALERFAQNRGRGATTKETGLVVGLVN